MKIFYWINAFMFLTLTHVIYKQFSEKSSIIHDLLFDI